MRFRQGIGGGILSEPKRSLLGSTVASSSGSRECSEAVPFCLRKVRAIIA